MQILIYALSVLLVLVCLLLVGSILMQLPRNEGLGTAFGGGMTENLFGAETANVLTKITVWLGIIFFALTLFLAVVYSYYHRQQGLSAIDRELLGSPAVVQPTPAPEATPAEEAAPATEATEQPAATTTEAAEKPEATPAPEATPETPAPEAAPAATPAAETPTAEQPAAAEEKAQPAAEAAPVATEATATPAATE